MIDGKRCNGYLIVTVLLKMAISLINLHKANNKLFLTIINSYVKKK